MDTSWRHKHDVTASARYDTDGEYYMVCRKALKGDNYKVPGKVPEEIIMIKVTHFQEKKLTKTDESFIEYFKSA